MLFGQKPFTSMLRFRALGEIERGVTEMRAKNLLYWG